MKRAPLKSTEKATQAAILQYLTLKRVFHWRNNTGAFGTEYKGKRRFVTFGAKGSPDIFALVDGTLYGIECKDVKPSAKLNENQIDFQQRLEAAGGVYVVARSLDDVTGKL